MIGRVIGEFRILRQIGKGGMGTVFEAHQASLDRIVALKVLGHTAALPQSAVLRFRREAQAAARLHHAHIVPIYAQGEAEGLHYYAMELVRGTTVYQIICDARGGQGRTPAVGGSPAIGAPLDPAETVLLGPAPQAAATGAERDFDEIARYVAQAADALEYAHSNNVIHRDIKPHNLMIGQEGKLRVSDFGLARILEQPGLTITGEFLGSPLYMSPEQISPGMAVVDHRSDIYSLGATLYEWLTLVPPFPGDTREQVIARVITADPAPPRSHDPRLPVDLDTICLKALDKDPRRRYARAADMRDDLLRYLERRTIRARRAGPLARVRRLVLRHRVASMAALAALIAVSLGAAYWNQRTISRDHKAVARVQTEKIAKAEQKNVELEDQLKALVGTLTPKVWTLLADSIGSSGDEEGREARRELAGRFAPAYLGDLLAAERRRLQRQRPDVKPGSGLEYYVAALGALAEENSAAAMTLLDRSLEQDPAQFHARRLRAILNCAQQQFDRMLSDAESLVAMRSDESAGFLLRGAALLFHAQPVSANKDLEWARELGDSSAWLDVLMGISRTQVRDFTRAMTDFALAIESDPTLVPALLGRGMCHYELHDYDAAIADATQVIEAEPDNAAAHVLRGQSYDQLEKYDESLADYARASTLKPGSLSIVARIAFAQANRQRKEQARPSSRRREVREPFPAERPRPGDDGERFIRSLRERPQS